MDDLERTHARDFRDAYKARFPDLIKDKVFIPRTREGIPHVEALDAARSLAERLSHHRAFVGVSVRGSAALGYSGSESDIDLGVMYDGSSGNGDAKELREINDSIVAFSNEYTGEGKRELHVFDFNVSAEKLRSCVFNNYPSGTHEVVEPLAALCELSTGPRVEEYRQIAADFMQELPEKDQEEIADMVADTLTMYERNRWGRITSRVRSLDSTQIRQFAADRKALWNTRVKRILSLPS